MEQHDNLRNEIKDLLRELAELDGVAGHEHTVVARLKDLFEPLCHTVTVDSFGNLYAHRAALFSLAGGDAGSQ